MQEFAKIKISHQGAIKVNRTFVDRKSRNILTVELDMGSKYVEISSTGEDNYIPNICLCANKRSLYLKEKYRNKQIDKKEPTLISFSELIGWDIFCAETSKYTVRICFVKKKNFKIK